MFRRHYNLILLGFWLVVAVCLLAPDAVLPEKVRQQFGSGGTLAGLLALTFALYNLVRWWALQAISRSRPARPVNPLAVRRHEPESEEPYAPNPDFDFLSLPSTTKPTPPPKPSTNGDHPA